jgi:DNA-binding PadR family transcriptional regulator
MSATRTIPKEEVLACPCTGATLDKLIQPAVLAALAEGPIHGYGLVERIGRMPSFAGETPDPSGVYRLLKAMEKKEMVVSSWDLSESGPAKKTYEITPQGRDCLRRWMQTLEQYRDDISALLGTVRKAVKR